MIYIQRQGKALKTVKACESESEAQTALDKFRKRQDATYYPSNKPCKGWKGWKINH